MPGGSSRPGVVAGRTRRTLVMYGAGFSLFLILLRLIWVYPGTFVANVIRKRVLHQRDQKPTARSIFVVGWTGMRGVISLAAAVALPQVLASGAPFQQRNMIIFLAFSVILVTLVLQGLTLPPLIRALGLAGSGTSGAEEKEARRAMAEAALLHIEGASHKIRIGQDALLHRNRGVDALHHEHLQCAVHAADRFGVVGLLQRV